MPQFQPLYIQEDELASFGLPDTDQQANIVSLVEAASGYIDEYCGRTDADGNGSLVWTSYSERIYLPEGRNLFRVSFRPFAAVPTVTQQLLAASGQNYYTGFNPNTTYVNGQGIPPDAGSLSPILSAFGRYGYSRRGSQQVYPDLNYGANILQIASFFGGPPAWSPIDISQVDFNAKNGEVWVPAGLYLSQYTEIVITYNSGFDPRDLPRNIKHACAMLVRNLLGRAGGTTGMKSMTAGRVNAQFTDDLVDPTVDRLLQPYKTVIAY